MSISDKLMEAIEARFYIRTWENPNFTNVLSPPKTATRIMIVQCKQCGYTSRHNDANLEQAAAAAELFAKHLRMQHGAALAALLADGPVDAV